MRMVISDVETFLNRHIREKYEWDRMRMNEYKRENISTDVYFCMLDAFTYVYMLCLCLLCCYSSFFPLKRKQTFSHFGSFSDFGWGSCALFWIIPHSHINCSHEWRLLTSWVGGYTLGILFFALVFIQTDILNRCTETCFDKSFS